MTLWPQCGGCSQSASTQPSRSRLDTTITIGVVEAKPVVHKYISYLLSSEVLKRCRHGLVMAARIVPAFYCVSYSNSVSFVICSSMASCLDRLVSHLFQPSSLLSSQLSSLRVSTCAMITISPVSFVGSASRVEHCNCTLPNLKG